MIIKGRVCNKCDTFKGFSYFSKNKYGKYGYKSICKICQKLPPKKVATLNENVKRCNWCDEIKNKDEFSKVNRDIKKDLIL